MTDARSDVVVAPAAATPADSPSAAVTQLVCYRCRRILFPSTALMTHTPGHVTAATFAGKKASNVSLPRCLRTPAALALRGFSPLPRSPSLTRPPLRSPLCQLSLSSSLCSSYFVDPDELEVGAFTDNEGKLSCPHCQSKLGSFTWSGSQCSCGEWVVPAFSFSRRKVDEKQLRGDGQRATVVAPVISFRPRLQSEERPQADSDAATQRREVPSGS